MHSFLHHKVPEIQPTKVWHSFFFIRRKPEVPARGKFQILLHDYKLDSQLYQAVSLVLYDIESCAIRQILATAMAIQMHYISKFSDKIFTNKNFKKVNFKFSKKHFFEKNHIFPSRKVCWPNNKSCSIFHGGNFGTNFADGQAFLILTTRWR